MIHHYVYRRNRSSFEPASPISKFIDACAGKPLSFTIPTNQTLLNSLPVLINILFVCRKVAVGAAQFLKSTDLFTSIHAAAAASGQTAVSDNLDTNLH
jgi:hypothetical protein